MFHSTDPRDPRDPFTLLTYDPPTDPLSTALIRLQFAIECLRRSSQQRQVNLGQSLGEERLTHVSPILIRSRKDMGLSYAKEIDLIFCRLSTILESSITDRQTDRPRNGNI